MEGRSSTPKHRRSENQLAGRSKPLPECSKRAWDAPNRYRDVKNRCSYARNGHGEPPEARDDAPWIRGDGLPARWGWLTTTRCDWRPHRPGRGRRMIPRRAREPLGVGRRPPAGEPQFLCPFQLDTRSLDRSVSGTLCASGAHAGPRGPAAALILMGDWRGSSRSDATRPRRRNC